MPGQKLDATTTSCLGLIRDHLAKNGHGDIAKALAAKAKLDKSNPAFSLEEMVDAYSKEHPNFLKKKREEEESSSSDGDSSEEEKKPAAKKVKKEESSDDDSSDDDDSSEEEEKPAAKKVEAKKEESSDDDSSDDDDSSEEEETKKDAVEDEDATPKRKLEWETPQSKSAKGAKHERRQNTPFQRVDPNEAQLVSDPRLLDNSFKAQIGESNWGNKANDILLQVKGKGFRHEKTKKKRGSYTGGVIDQDSRSIKFNLSDDSD